MLSNANVLKTIVQKRHFSSSFGIPKLPKIENEPMRSYLPGTPERKELREELQVAMKAKPMKIPIVVNGKEIHEGPYHEQRMPFDHKKIVAISSMASKETLQKAVDGAMEARTRWQKMSWNSRAAIFLKAADLASTKYRLELLTSTMLGQGKTLWQAEIDTVGELIDFWRFNVRYADELYHQQPDLNALRVWNHVEYRPLDGFVAAISPFNFTAIGGNLAVAPAIMGNTVLWKPGPTASASAWVVYKILMEAGLPEGVIQFTPAQPNLFSEVVIRDKRLGGVHFTGSTGAFMNISEEVNRSMESRICFPRLVGETGGKDFHMVHKSADIDHVVASTIRGAFEYSGQKCSACSRIYIPDNLYEEFKKKFVSEVKKIKVGPTPSFDSFMSAVIDKKSFDKIKGYIEKAKNSKDCEIITGGQCDDSVGYFVEPTTIVTRDPNFVTIREEIFGPVLTAYVYDSSKPFHEILKQCDATSPYALTGAVFAQDRSAIEEAYETLRFSAGNFYINDKCTGAVVGQQPFGGARKSGTNDKSGGPLNLLRWVSARSVKENFVPLKYNQWNYPHVSKED